MNLADQDWLRDARTQTLLAAFGEVPLRFVGGCVRDAIMGRRTGDVDCTTPATPEQVTQLLENAGLKAVPTGIAHGTVTAVVNGKPFEITTLRKDIACDGRHAEVVFTNKWEEDAARRDFTLNALYCDANGEVYDYTGGIEAAKAGRIAFIGDASARIQEDALRILRFFRFYATHGSGAPDEAALTACGKHKEMLAQLSGERIQQEMLKLLAAPGPLKALKVAQEVGVLEALIPDASLALLEILQNLSVPAHPLLRLALLVPDEAGAQAVCERWKLSNHDRALLLLLVTHPYNGWPENELEMLKIARHLTPETYPLLLMRNAAQLGKDKAALLQALAQASALQIPIFPVKGADLIARGYEAGPTLGETLKKLEDQWEVSEYRLTKDELVTRL